MHVSQRNPDGLIELGVMAKFWNAGLVKTRLGASIGMQQAAMVHQIFCRYLSQQLRLAAGRREFVVSPVETVDGFRQTLPDDWQVRPQSSGDLGQRMKHWFGRALAPGTSASRILIGADCPLVDQALIDEASRGLLHHDVVLGPALDGGYYLIGIAGAWTAKHDALMNNMPWSSNRVFDLTCQRAEQAGLTLQVLRPMEDIDTTSELDRLRQQLRSAEPGSPQARLGMDLDRVLVTPG
ncbi:MAG: TIGR04282 family arsenosugar biosynthesis glycosyltransferase [Planctomycetota bacterium]